MATVNLEGFGQVELPDNFVELSPEQQDSELQKAMAAGPVVEESEEDVSTFRDIAEGVGAGVVGLAQGLSESAAIGFDLATDSNTSRGVTETFEGLKETLGFTPETTAGEVANLVTNFGLGAIVPLSWVSRARAAATGTQSMKAVGALGKSAEAFGKSATGKALLTNAPGRIATTSLAVGAADFFVSPNGLNTISDAFDALPDELETEEDTGLVGAEEAARRFRNKLRIAAEGATLSGAIDIAVPVIGKTVGTVAQAPGIAPISRRISASMDYLGEMAGRVNWLKKGFTSTGLLPRNLFETLSDARGMTDEAANDVLRLVENFDQTARGVVSSKIPFFTSKKAVERAYTDLERYLEGDLKALDDYGADVIQAGSLLRGQVDELSDRVSVEVESMVARGEIAPEQGVEIIKTIDRNRGKYLRRLYEGPLDITNPAEFRSTADYAQSVDEVAKFFSRTTDDSEEVVRANAIQFVDGQLGLQDGLRGLDPKVAMKNAKKNLADINNITKAEVPLYDLSDSILTRRNRILESAPTLRRLKQEKTGTEAAVKERVVKTVTDLSQFSAMSKMYRSILDDPTLAKPFEGIAETLNAGGAPMIIRRPMDAVDETGAPMARDFSSEEIATLNRLGYVELGESAKGMLEGPFGALSGNMVRKELKDVLVFDRMKDTVFNKVLAISLQAKGISQLGQTALNPVGQIRNAYGNILMLGANGNLARFSDVSDSFGLVFGKAANLTDEEFKRHHQYMGDLGLRDQNVIQNEYRLLMREGKELTPADEAVRSATQKGMERFVPFYQPLQKAYSGVDNMGKTAALFAEQAKYANALRRAGINPENAGGLAESFINTGLAVRPRALNEEIPFLTVMSADTVKATMPIYSRVPEAVRMIRRVPVFGNFIAFPAEVIRNTTNILQRSMREMGVKPADFIDGIRAANPNMSDRAVQIAANRLAREIKAIGAKRLTGLYTVTLGATSAVQTAMMRLNGMDDSDMEAMQEFAAPFQRGHALAPVSFDRESGKIEFVDLSYMMPYDYVVDPVRQAMRTYAEKGEIGAGEAEQILSGARDAAFSLLDPFAGEALIAERLIDVTTRNGRTDLGATIYREGDDEGEKLIKSFTHVLGGFNPAMMKYVFDVRRGELEPGRLVRAVTDEPGRQGQEYTVQEELLSLMTGFRKQEMDLKTALQYKGFEYGGAANSIKSNFRSNARAADVSANDLQAEFSDLQSDLRRLQGNLARSVQQAEQLGMSRSEIRRALKEANVGSKEIRAIMRNEFEPYYASKDLSRDIRKKAREQENRLLPRLNRGELNRAARELRRQQLLQTPEIPQNIPAPQLPSTPIPSTVGPATAPQSNVSPSLLGDNPVEQARNMELAQRLRGQS